MSFKDWWRAFNKFKERYIEIMIDNKANEVREELFWWLFARCQTGLETTMKGGSINFDHVHLLYYKYHLKKSKSW